MALTPPNTTVAKSDVEVFYFIFYDPHISLKPTKYQEKKKTQTSVVNCFLLKLAKTGNLMLLGDVIKVSSLIYICLYRSVYLSANSLPCW